MTLIVNETGLTPDIAVVSDRADLMDSLGHVDEMALALIANSRDCVKILGLDGSLIFMNANGRCAMAVTDYDAIRGKAWPILWPETMRDTIMTALSTGRRGGVARFIGTCPTGSGDVKIWDVLVTPVFDGVSNSGSDRTSGTDRNGFAPGGETGSRRSPAYLLCVSKDITANHSSPVPETGLRIAGFPRIPIPAPA